MNITVHGWTNFQAMREIFDKEFNPADGIYGVDTPDIKLYSTGEGGADNWSIYVQYKAPRKFTTSQYEMFRMFLRGVQATIYHRGTNAESNTRSHQTV